MKNRLNIQIDNNYKFTEQFLNIKLTDLYCKHVIKHNLDDKSKSVQLLNVSQKLGYKWCEWGSHEGFSSDLSHHLSIITGMERDGYDHAIRIVICKYNFSNKLVVWTDNLHSTIKYIREYGKNVRLKDIPFYVIDMTKLEQIRVLSYNKSLRLITSDILGAVSNAYYRYEMSNSPELINIGYIVSDILNDNPELYTYYNKHLGAVNENDSSLDILEKAQAFNKP